MAKRVPLFLLLLVKAFSAPLQLKLHDLDESQVAAVRLSKANHVHPRPLLAEQVQAEIPRTRTGVQQAGLVGKYVVHVPQSKPSSATSLTPVNPSELFGSIQATLKHLYTWVACVLHRHWTGCALGNATPVPHAVGCSVTFTSHLPQGIGGTSQSHMVLDMEMPCSRSGKQQDEPNQGNRSAVVHTGQTVLDMWAQWGHRTARDASVEMGYSTRNGDEQNSHGRSRKTQARKIFENDAAELLEMEDLSSDKATTDGIMSCAVALQAPNVALLFLTRGELYHEATWWLWFRHAAALIPTTAIMRDAATCQASGKA
eukprot:jgi/Botrbrau1/6103/Bobra.177_1s0040.1